MCVVIVIALVLFPEEMLPTLRVMGSGAHGTRRDGEDDRHDEKRCDHSDGDDLSRSDGTGWGENCEGVITHDVMYLEYRLAMRTRCFVISCSFHAILAAVRTGPGGLIGVTQVLWSSHEHFCIGDRRPEWHHVVISVMANRSVFHWVVCRA